MPLSLFVFHMCSTNEPGTLSVTQRVCVGPISFFSIKTASGTLKELLMGLKNRDHTLIPKKEDDWPSHEKLVAQAVEQV